MKPAGSTLAAALGAAAALAAGLLARGSLSTGPLPVRRSETVVPAPASPATLRVRLRDGAARPLDVPRGKVLAVHFWATWCLPCADELPSLRAFLATWKDPRLEVLAVSVDDDWKTVDAWLAARKAATFATALDPRREAARALGTEKFPETWFLGEGGRVLARVAGPLDWGSPETRSRIEALVKSAGPG